MARNIDSIKIDSSIQSIKKYINEPEIVQFIAILEELKKDPDNSLLVAKLSDEIDNIGVLKGAVLTYAPYITSLLSDDPFADT